MYTSKCGLLGMSFVGGTIWTSLGIGSGNVVRWYCLSVGILMVWELSLDDRVRGVVCGGVLSMLLFTWGCFVAGGPASPRSWLISSILNAFGIDFDGPLNKAKNLSMCVGGIFCHPVVSRGTVKGRANYAAFKTWEEQHWCPRHCRGTNDPDRPLEKGASGPMGTVLAIYLGSSLYSSAPYSCQDSACGPVRKVV